MTSTFSRAWWQVAASIVFVGCTSAPTMMTSGHTTTTYGGTTDGDSADDSVPGDASSDNGDPGEVTDDGVDTNGDPSDDTDDPWHPDLGYFPDLGLPDGLPDGEPCTSDEECSAGNCWTIPFLGGFCGECNEDADCDGGGCTPPNPFDQIGPFCNMGELGGGCETDEVCAGDLSCSSALDLLGLIQLNTCGECKLDADCGGQLCAPLVDLAQFSGQNSCIDPHSLSPGAYCDLAGNGDEACASGFCSAVDIMGLAEIGACGECNTDDDCDDGGFCVPGELVLDEGVLLGSTCE